MHEYECSREFSKLDVRARLRISHTCIQIVFTEFHEQRLFDVMQEKKRRRVVYELNSSLLKLILPNRVCLDITNHKSSGMAAS